jgi:hypothetical protein
MLCLARNGSAVLIGGTMLAVVGFVLAVIGIILNLVGKHTDWITWLLLIGLALVCAEVAWGWRRSGYYRRA